MTTKRSLNDLLPDIFGNPAPAAAETPAATPPASPVLSNAEGGPAPEQPETPATADAAPADPAPTTQPADLDLALASLDKMLDKLAAFAEAEWPTLPTEPPAPFERQIDFIDQAGDLPPPAPPEEDPEDDDDGGQFVDDQPPSP